MNWKLYGVTYTPLQRIYDRQKEGRAAWWSRTVQAANEGKLYDADGVRLAYVPRFEEEDGTQ